MKLTAFFSALLLLIISNVAIAQTTEPKPVASPKSAATKTKVNAEAELKERARREQARSLLVALSTDARNFRDSTLRARSLARIADALWQADTDQAKALFRKAWETSTPGRATPLPRQSNCFLTPDSQHLSAVKKPLLKKCCLFRLISDSIGSGYVGSKFKAMELIAKWLCQTIGRYGPM